MHHITSFYLGLGPGFGPDLYLVLEFGIVLNTQGKGLYLEFCSSPYLGIGAWGIVNGYGYGKDEMHKKKNNAW